MTKHAILLAAAAPMLLLGGCMGTQNRGLESVHQPVVSRADYAIDLATRGGALAGGERERLDGWFEGMRLGFGDQVTVDDPSGTGRGAEHQVADVAAHYGVLLAAAPPVSTAPVAPGTVRVVVSRARASVPGCPDYSRNSSIEYDSNTSSNYGCSTNTNLAVMIARPTDLVQGRSSDSYLDPVVGGRAIDAFRKRAPSGGGGGTVQSAGGVGGK